MDSLALYARKGCYSNSNYQQNMLYDLLRCLLLMLEYSHVMFRPNGMIISGPKELVDGILIAYIFPLQDAARCSSSSQLPGGGLAGV